jgi:nucleotide-binding universal stress UspA family protein
MQAKKILVGVDGSARQQAILDAALSIAQAMGGKIWLYRAVGIPNELPAFALVSTPSDLVPLLLAAAKESVRALAQKVPPDRLGDTIVSLAIPWQGVCEAAHDLAADLIVIGSHGYGTLDHLLGTTAARVVNHADRPVLVVKRGEPP